MNDTRRGFLKTLGKLAAAAGITFAVASTPAKAPKSTAPKAKEPTWKYGFTGFKKMETTPLTYEALEEGYQKAVKGQIRYASNVCVTNRPDVSKAVEMTSRHQEWLNRVTMARIDNISMTLKPEILLKDLMD